MAQPRARLTSWRCATSVMSSPTACTVTKALIRTAASETAIKARASRRPSWPRPKIPRSAIPGQAEPVTAAKDGLHNSGVGGVLLDLAPQVLHVRVDRPLVAIEFVAADAVDQLEPRVHPAGYGGERDEDAPLGRSQVHRLTPDQDSPARLVDLQCAVPEPAYLLIAVGRRLAPQYGLHSQDKLARAEGLRHVVVGAEL